MPFHIALFAAIFRRGSSLHEQVAGLTLPEQINICRQREAEARALAASQSPEKREFYLHLASDWANLAVATEFEYYVRLR